MVTQCWSQDSNSDLGDRRSSEFFDHVAPASNVPRLGSDAALDVTAPWDSVLPPRASVSCLSSPWPLSAVGRS